MQCNAMQCNAMQCNAMQCNAMQCNAMQCNAMQCNAMQCNAMQCNAMQCNAMQCYFTLIYTNNLLKLLIGVNTIMLYISDNIYSLPIDDWRSLLWYHTILVTSVQVILIRQTATMVD